MKVLPPTTCPQARITTRVLLVACLVLLFAAVALLSPASAMGESKAGDETAAMRRHWDRACSEVQSAEITDRHVHRPVQAGISREHLPELLGQADLVGKDAAITKLVRTLDPTIPANGTVKLKYVYDGNNQWIRKNVAGGSTNDRRRTRPLWEGEAPAEPFRLNYAARPEPRPPETMRAAPYIKGLVPSPLWGARKAADR